MGLSRSAKSPTAPGKVRLRCSRSWLATATRWRTRSLRARQVARGSSQKRVPVQDPWYTPSYGCVRRFGDRLMRGGAPSLLPGQALADGHHARLGQSRTPAGLLRRVGLPVQPAQLRQPRAALPHPHAPGRRGPTGHLQVAAQGRADPAGPPPARAEHGTCRRAWTSGAPNFHGAIDYSADRGKSRGTKMETPLGRYLRRDAQRGGQGVSGYERIGEAPLLHEPAKPGDRVRARERPTVQVPVRAGQLVRRTTSQ